MTITWRDHVQQGHVSGTGRPLSATSMYVADGGEVVLEEELKKRIREDPRG